MSAIDEYLSSVKKKDQPSYGSSTTNLEPGGGSAIDRFLQDTKSRKLDQITSKKINVQQNQSQPKPQKNIFQDAIDSVKNFFGKAADTIKKLPFSPISSPSDIAQKAFETGSKSITPLFTTKFGANQRSLADDMNDALRDFRPFGKPAYAPAKETQKGNIKELTKSYQEESQKSLFKRFDKDVGLAMTNILQGASGGVFKGVDQPKTLDQKITASVFNIMGSAYTIEKIATRFGGMAASNETLTNILDKNPTVKKFALPLIKNVIGFDLYGQLDPQTKNRFNQLMNDTAMGILFTPMGFIGKARYSVPLSFGLGFSLAKLNGANNEDAFITGGVLAALDSGGKIKQGLLENRIKQGTREFTPNQAINLVFKSHLDTTEMGRNILKASEQAYRENKNVEISMQASKKSFAGNLFNVKTPEGINLGINLVDRTLELDPSTEAVRPEDVQSAKLQPVIKPTQENIPQEGQVTKIEQIPQMEKAASYTSAEDFATAVYSAKPEQQIGLVDPKTISIRDNVDKNSRQYQSLKADIQQNGIQEPIRIDAIKKEPQTVDGSTRTAIAQELGIKVPVIVNRGIIKGLPTIQEVYDQNVTAPLPSPTEGISKVQAQKTPPPSPKPVAFNSKKAREFQGKFTTSYRTIIDKSESQTDMIKTSDSFINKAIEKSAGNKTYLAGIRTALQKEMMSFVGQQGSYKANYAMLKTLMQDPDIGDYLSNLETHIAKIDTMIKEAGDTGKPQVFNFTLEDGKKVAVEYQKAALAKGTAGEADKFKIQGKKAKIVFPEQVKENPEEYAKSLVESTFKQKTIPSKAQGQGKPLPEVSQPKETSVMLTMGTDFGFNKFVEQDIKPGIEDTKQTVSEIKSFLSYIKNNVINIIQPALPVERKLGGNAYSSVIRAIHTPEAEALSFDTQQSKTFDRNFAGLEKFFGKFSDEELRIFNLTRGEPESKGAQALQQEALSKLNPVLKDPELTKAIKEVSDYVYDFATKNNIELSYMEDYFYGTYKRKGESTVSGFLDYWRSTERYTKEKKLPTIADALDFGLELKNENPISNIRSEMFAVAQRVGLQRLKQDIEANGLSYGVQREAANEAQLKKWQKINDPVFNGMIFDPDFARFVNNLISTNKISQSRLLHGLRQTTFFAQQIKFFGSIFHLRNMFKASVSDETLGIVNPGGWIDFAKSFKSINKGDPLYKEYLNLGGGHRYSLESQSQTQMSEFIKRLESGNAIGMLLRLPAAVSDIKYIPASPGFIRWMFDEEIPALKYQKYTQEVFKKSQKLGRTLTDQEKIDIIKTNQNFYGEMNERLFGRSGTVTSALRLIFTAPGYGEGNFRALFKASKGDRKSANFVLHTLITTLIMATLGTVILTKKWPDVPKKLRDIRDLFKIKTNLKDGNGDVVYYDMMSYDSDYWAIYGNLFTGQLSKIPSDLTQRVAGMFSTPAKILTDMSTLMQGGMVYDYKGQPAFYRTDDFGTKLSKMLQRWGGVGAPISSSTFSTTQQKGTSIAESTILSVLGIRASTSEEVKRTKAARQDMFSLEDAKKNKQIDLNALFNENPQEAIKQAREFNKGQLQKLKSIFKDQGIKAYDPKIIKSYYLITKLKKGKPKKGTNLGSMLLKQPK